MSNALLGRAVRLEEPQFAKREGVSVPTVRNWRKKGYAPAHYKIGRKVYFDLDDVIRWENAQKAKTL